MNICKFCNIEFTPKVNTKGIFCSLSCYHKNMKGKDILKNNRYSGEPWNKNKKMSQEYCKNITKALEGVVRNRVYLKGRQPWHNLSGLTGVNGSPSWNKGKKLPQMSGENHPNWKGNSTQHYRERRRFRSIMQKKIFVRDNYTCQICDQYGGYLQVDHIKSWADYPELRFEESNCRTLCMACHYYVTFKRKLPEGVIWGHNFSKRVVS